MSSNQPAGEAALGRSPAAEAEPVNHPIAGIQLPGTAAATEATALVRERLSPLVFDHSRRVFLFGALRARDLGLSVDPELLYLAALFHDAALSTPYADAAQRFEVDGADLARAFMLESRVLRRRQPRSSGRPIALHTTPGVPVRMGPEIAATAYGVLVDTVGLDLDTLDRAEVDEITSAHPRGDFKREFVHTFVEGLRDRPDTTYGTVYADIPEHSVPGFRRSGHGGAHRGIWGGRRDRSHGRTGRRWQAVTASDPCDRCEGSGADEPAPSARRRERRDRPRPCRGLHARRAGLAEHVDRSSGPRPRRRACPATSCRVWSTALGYGTTGLTVGQRVFGLTDWARDGTLAEYTAVEARNLAPLPADVEHVEAAASAISGLTAWQGLFDHGRLMPGQTVLIHGAAGARRLARGPARPGGGCAGGGHRPRRPPRRRVGPGRAAASSTWTPNAVEVRGRGGRGVRRDRRRGARAIDGAGASRRDGRHRRRAAHRAARGRSGRLLRRRTGSCRAHRGWLDASGPGRSRRSSGRSSRCPRRPTPLPAAAARRGRPSSVFTRN